MRVHEIIEQQHTEAETESKEYRHQAEIFFGGYLAETAEGNCDGDCKHRPEQLAVRQFALIITEMEDYSRRCRDCKPDHFDELVIRIVALYKAKTEQKKRFKSNYNILAENEYGADNRRKDKKPYSLHTQDGDKTGYKEANPHEPISGKIVLYAFSDAFKFRVFCQVHAPH